jgi:hypothetical protein
MTLRPLHLLHLAVLRAASLLIPRHQRAEWWREWSSELWHVRQARTPHRGISWPAEREIAEFCLGAFQDARYLRAQSLTIPSAPKRLPRATTMGSAAQCTLLLAALIVISFGIALMLPGVRAEIRESRFHLSPDLVLIQSARAPNESSPTISAEQFHLWKARRQQVFDSFAFYKITQEPIPTASHPHAALAIAHATPNLFQLVGIPLEQTQNNKATTELSSTVLPGVILSEALWTRTFHRDPNLAGKTVQIGHHKAIVAGIALAGYWKLPGKVDAWLLESDEALPSNGNGFVAAHLAPTFDRETLGHRWHMSAPLPDENHTSDDFLCISIASLDPGHGNIFLFAIILACLALPATTSLPLGEYRVGSQKLSWQTRLRRWSFLTAKLALLLPLVYLISLDLSHLNASVGRDTTEYIQLIASFSICLFGLRWTLRDQRQRCPVCLRKLTNPARVGQPSRNFLAWNGTELICVSGHGLLHVPEMPTSWFSTQRWLYLDPSWQVLFADPTLASAYF